MASETIKKSQRPGMRRAKIIKMKSENEVANAKRIFDHTWPFGSLAVLRPNYVSPNFGACNFAPQFFGGAGMRRSNFEENLSNLRAHLIFTGQCRPQFPRVAKLRPPKLCPQNCPHNFRAAISHPKKTGARNCGHFRIWGAPPRQKITSSFHRKKPVLFFPGP